MNGQPAAQPAIPPELARSRPRANFGFRVARRGWALVRAVFLMAFTGFLLAMVAATIFAGLVIAINGELP